MVLCIALLAITLTACEYFGGGGCTYETADGIKDAQKELDSKFGKGAGYTDVMFSFHKDVGTVITATGTPDLNSAKLIERHRMKGIWKDLSEITMEISGEGKPRDFMFTLDQVDLSKIPAMVKQAKEKIQKEKGIDKVIASSVSLSMPDKLDNKEDGNPTYHINVEPESGGTTFSFVYDVKGNFKNLIY
ncbi:hypothetical protein FLA_1862 [Filimonas lacunae]|nr:hypothetical protein FLA_1862 [Filimonas lacunae]